MTRKISDNAVDALIAAALRAGFSEDAPSDASIEAAILDAAQQPQDPARLQRIRDRIDAPNAKPSISQISGRLMAMNRKNEDEVFCDSTEKALDEARQKAIEELLNEEERKEGEDDNA